MKRGFDIAVSMLLMGIAAPLLLTLAAICTFAHGWPFWFTQQRTGLYGKPFKIIKFRTMTDICGPDGAALPDEQRLTRIGRFLRACSLDELPELWNVMKGEMSLVGPRPLLPQYLPLYSPDQARRHEVRPGITGWAQVNGRNALDWDEKFRLDVWYVDHRNLWLDLRILALTVAVLINRRGIHYRGHATMPPFQGKGR